MVWDGIAQGGRCLGAVTEYSQRRYPQSTEVFYRRRLLDRAAKFRERGVYNVYEERLSVHRIAPPTGTAHRMALSKLSAAQARCGDVSPGTRLMRVAASRDPTASRAGAERECAVRGVPRTGVLRRVARECLETGECAGRWAPFVAKRSSAASWLCAARSSRASPRHSAQREAPEDKIRSDNRQKANGRLFLPPRQLEQSYE